MDATQEALVQLQALIGQKQNELNALNLAAQTLQGVINLQLTDRASITAEVARLQTSSSVAVTSPSVITPTIQPVASKVK